MKLPKNQNLESSGGIRIQNLKKIFLYLALLIPLGLFNGCSSDDDGEQEPPIDTSVPYSVSIGESNKNMPSGGKITSEFSDSPAGSDISKIVDNNTSTKFITTHTKFYIIWEGNKNSLINSYTLTSAGDAPEKDPKSWVLSASSDKNIWITLDTQTGQTFSQRKEEKEYKFENDTEYRYYKLDIQSNNGDADTQVAEWGMKFLRNPLLPYSVTVSNNNQNMPSGGVITSQYSDFPEGSDIGKIVDSNASTKFVTGYSEFYILWEGNEEEIVNYYTITSAGDTPEMDPKSWTLSGSDDGETWTEIDARENQAFAERYEKKKYELENEKAYTYYRLDIKSNNGGTSTQIAEWTMLDILSKVDNLINKYGSGHSHTDKTPMGRHYENWRAATTEDIAWLLDPANDDDLHKYDNKWAWVERPVNLYPYGDPLPADANQHGIGDCCAIAVFASFAYVHPDFIKSIIKDNGDKTYTVSMYDPKGTPIKVKVNSKVLVNNYGNGDPDCVTGKSNQITWATILEKAIMKYNHRFENKSDIGGIGTENVVPLFTGNGDSFSIDPFTKITAEELSWVVKVCLERGKFVIGGFRHGGMTISDEFSDLTVNGHAYTFMHSSNSKALFAMRNPWGGWGNALDAVVNIYDLTGRNRDNNKDSPASINIPSMIDLRIVEAGEAAKFGSGVLYPYNPPLSAAEPMRVSERLLRQVYGTVIPN